MVMVSLMQRARYELSRRLRLARGLRSYREVTSFRYAEMQRLRKIEAGSHDEAPRRRVAGLSDFFDLCRVLDTHPAQLVDDLLTPVDVWPHIPCPAALPTAQSVFKAVHLHVRRRDVRGRRRMPELLAEIGAGLGVGARTVSLILAGQRDDVLDLVMTLYLAHPPGDPRARLSAHLETASMLDRDNALKGME